MRHHSTDNRAAKNAVAGGVLLHSSDTPAPSEISLPSSETLQAELEKENYRNRFFNTFRSTVFGLITVAAMAVLVAVLFLPVLHIYGQSMNGTLDNGDIVVSVKSSEMETGEIIAFYYNNNTVTDSAAVWTWDSTAGSFYNAASGKYLTLPSNKNSAGNFFSTSPVALTFYLISGNEATVYHVFRNHLRKDRFRDSRRDSHRQLQVHRFSFRRTERRQLDLDDRRHQDSGSGCGHH